MPEILRKHSVKAFFLFKTLLILAGCSLFGPQGPNLAFQKPVYHSSCKQWVDTGQMAVDGQESTHWVSRPDSSQWIYVDLGKSLNVNRVILKWDKEYAVEYMIDVSDDAQEWTQVIEIQDGDGNVDDLCFNQVKTRYVRLFCFKKSESSGYSLNEMEVYGENEIVSSEEIEPVTVTEELTYLKGAWKLADASFIKETGEDISKAGYNDDSWLKATVPGTVLATYLDNGVLPDPNYGDQQFLISESLSLSQFWYRTEFIIPEDYPDKSIWLNFDGINYEADIFCNGEKVGNMKGAFIRGRFDITEKIKRGETNALAVLIYPVEHPGDVSIQFLDSPGVNGGDITLDGPTFISSNGWDWMPTIRGRNTGIWQDVFIKATGPVTIADPFVISDLPLPETDYAELTVIVEIKNNSDKKQTGTLACQIGQLEKTIIEKSVTLNPGQLKEIILKPDDYPELRIENPRLWWPNGYGSPELYTVELSFKMENGLISDTLSEQFGIREVEVINESVNDPIVVWINGEKILIKGGNWGIDDSMKRADERRLRILMRYHQEANLNMIRNWAGQTTQENFYELCDEFGFLVWDDFWLVNVSDGPDPLDVDLFLGNAVDKIKRYRNHPCIILWCARNESPPPEAVDTGLREALEKYDWTRRYQAESDYDGVSGHGPYSWYEPVLYYDSVAGGFTTEIGLPCIPSIESIMEMMPEEYLWKENDMWGVHDYCNGNLKAFSYTMALMKRFGKSSSMEIFSKKSQMLNMEGYKSIFEAWGNKMWNDCTGVLLWMSNPAWPTFAFQLYDYYLEPTAAYFAVKKACEPVHILWDRSTDYINIVNSSLKPEAGLLSVLEIYNMDGTLKYRDTKNINASANSVIEGFKVQYPDDLSNVHFLKLELRDAENNLISDNFYWRGLEEDDYNDLNSMNRVELMGEIETVSDGNHYQIIFSVENPSSDVALMIRLKPVKDKSKQRILPVFFSDNYFSLLPGETKQIEIGFLKEELEDENPSIVIEGWNIIEKEIPVR